MVNSLMFDFANLGKLGESTGCPELAREQHCDK
jgi:hypothetical protein